VVSFTPIQIIPGKISYDPHSTGCWLGIRASSDEVNKQMSWTCRKSNHDFSVILSLNSQIWDILIFILLYFNMFRPSSSIGIATELGAGRSGIESRWGRDFPTVQADSGTYPAFCKMGTGSFPRVKCGRGVLLTTHALLVPRSWKSRAIPLPTLWATPGL